MCSQLVLLIIPQELAVLRKTRGKVFRRMKLFWQNRAEQLLLRDLETG